MRRLAQVALLIVTLIVGAAAAAAIVSQTAWFKDWLRGFIVRQANQYLNGSLAIDHLAGNLFFGLELRQVSITQDGVRVVSIEQADVSYDPVSIATSGIVVDDIRLQGLVLRIERTEEGWTLARMVKTRPKPAEPRGPGRSIDLQAIHIENGTFYVEDQALGTSGVNLPGRFEHVDAKIALDYRPTGFTVALDRMSFRAEEPRLHMGALSGRVRVEPDRIRIDDLALQTASSSLQVDGEILRGEGTPALHVTAASDGLDLGEIARVVPAVGGIPLRPAFRVEANGPTDRLGVDFELQSSAGDVSGEVTTNLRARSRGVAGVVRLTRLDLAPILKRPSFSTRLTGTARIDLALDPRPQGMDIVGTYRFTAPEVEALGFSARQVEAQGRLLGQAVTVDARAQAYGANATTAGTVSWGLRGAGGPAGSRVAYDLKGQVFGADLRQLPSSLRVPRVTSELNVPAYHLRAEGRDLRADATLADSELAGARLGSGTEVSFSRHDGRASYTAKGRVSDLDVRRIGREFKIAALDQPRFESRLNGSYAVSGAGTAVDELRLDAEGLLQESAMGKASFPRMAFEVHLADRRLDAVAKGGFANLDPAVWTGTDRVAGDLNGRADLRVVVPDVRAERVAPEMEVAGQVWLEPSSLAKFPIEQATVDGAWAGQKATVRTLTLTTPTIQANASGVLDLTESGSSNLEYRVEASDLAPLQPFTGREIGGAATIEGRVEGNGSALVAPGKLSARRLSMPEFEALTVNSDFRVEVPSLEFERLTARARTSASFLNIAGQEITEIEAQTTYTSPELRFDASIGQTERDLQAAGRLVLHPQHQEVHIERFVLATPDGMTWQTEPGSESAIEYGADRIAVDGLRLVSQYQQIVANGTIGEKESALRATFTNVDLAGLDRLLPGERGVAGRLDGEAVVSGPRADLRVEATMQVTGGAFQTFQYEVLSGKVVYAADRIAVDVRLEQSPRAWLFARGSVPVALVQAEAPTGEAATAPLDLHVESTPIDLGIVQGFTDVVRDVQGTLQAKVELSGTVADPRLEGYVDVRQGRLTVEPTGATYTLNDVRVELESNRVRLPEFLITDGEKDTLTLAGNVGVEERRLTGLDFTVKSKSFSVLENELGDVEVNADLRVSGEIDRPRVTGTIEVADATLNVDTLLAQVGTSPYATTSGPTPGSAVVEAREKSGVAEPGAAPEVQREAAAEGAKKQATPEPARPGLFSGAAVALRVRMPDNFVVRGKDLQVGQSPIGLGNLNITIGGDVHVEKPRGSSDVILLGEVETVRGYYDFQGRRFDILRDGRVRFEGHEQINPSLDISAQRVIQGVEALVHIRGTLRAPELVLSSNPPQDQADILSLIVFGQPANQLGEGERVSLAQRAGALASGFVASKLAESIGEALDLDLFEITPTLEPGGRGATVTLGEQLGERLYVRLQQGVGADSTSRLVLDYALAPFLRLETTVSQGAVATQTLMRRVERTGVDLIFFFSY